MRKILYLLLFIPYSVFAQYKIHLNKGNTFNNGKNYLIDIPVTDNLHNLLLIDDDSLLPANFTNLHVYIERTQVDTIIIAKKIISTEKFFDKSRRYRFGGNSFMLLSIAGYSGADTLKVNEKDFKKYNFKEPPLKLPEDSILIYYEEGYGSTCCPRDPKWDSKVTLGRFIKAFEKKHNTKIGKMYFFAAGDEGENTTYLTLSGLTGDQKIAFIAERTKELMLNKEIVSDTNCHHIYLPYIVFNPDIWKMAVKDRPKSMTYDDHHITELPLFPGGEQELWTYISKKVHYKSDWPIQVGVSVVINQNGAVTDIKLTGGGDDPINEKIFKALKTTLWNPGTINGMPVNVRYNVKIRVRKL